MTTPGSNTTYFELTLTTFARSDLRKKKMFLSA